MVRKQHIMEKALELFAEQGFEATSVQQITDRCGISKGAFYLSFKSKDELILALIDRFVMQIITEIDQAVRETPNNEDLLYTFFYTSFRTFDHYSDFAKILIKEQTHTLNEDLLNKLHMFNQQTEKIILSMIEKVYGKEIEPMKYDLIYTVKGLMNSYSEFLLFHPSTPDLDLLSKSLAEKTNVLAVHATIPFVTREFHQVVRRTTHNEEMSPEQIVDLIEQKLDEMEESIEKESLVLLKHELLNPSLRPALIKGLLENIRNHPKCKWIAYLLGKHFQADL